MRNALAAMLALAFIPAVALAQPKAEDVEITLGGGGINNKDFDAGSFNINGSVGYFITKNFEISLRQSVSYADFNDGTAWNGSTRLAADFQFDLGRFQPFIGANIGYIYGDSVNDTWAAAPEAGIKYYVTEAGRTFIFAMAEYQIFFRDAEDADFDDGQFVYTVGIGFNLP